jgi:hypothetical protein
MRPDGPNEVSPPNETCRYPRENRDAALLIASGLALLAASPAPEQGKALPGTPAPASVVGELQRELAHATGRLQAMDEAGLLGHVSDRYRSDSFTKAALREQLRLLFLSTTPSSRRFRSTR